MAEVSGFLQGAVSFLFSFFFFFVHSLFVNKVVLSQACLYELCWIEHERMLLAHHGNILAP